MNTGLDSFERFISEIDCGMPVEVMRDFDTVLLFGKLTEVSPETLTVRCVSNGVRFPILEEESLVLVRCYDVRMDPVLLQAKVVRSSEAECTIGEPDVIPYKTPRKYVRYPLCPPAMISVLDGGAPEQPQPCQLLNISAGGACIVSENPYVIKQRLCLQIKLAKTDKYAAYPCKIVRVTPRGGGYFEYGLSFCQLNKEQCSCLANTLQDHSYLYFGIQKDALDE